MDQRLRLTQSEPYQEPPEPQQQEQEPQQQPQQQPQQAQQPAAPQRRGVKIWPERARRGPEEEGWFDEVPESVYNPQQIVTRMLEDDYDAHVKAHRQHKVAKWDKARATYQDLGAKKAEAAKLFSQLGTSIGYERALAQVGLRREHVARPIYGNQIGATHNYKKTAPVKMCQDEYCDMARKPQGGDECGRCGGPLAVTQARVSPNELRGKYARHMVGVETTDGKYVWFDEMVPPH